MARQFTPTQFKVLEAAFHGDAGNAALESRRVRTRTINDLTAEGLLYGRNIDYRIELTPDGLCAYNDVLDQRQRAEFKARFPRWEHLAFDYGRWTTTHENYDVSWEGEEDGYVDNGLMCEGRTLEELAEEVEAKEAEMAEAVPA